MTTITSGRVTIPAWRVMRAAWARSQVTLAVLLGAFGALGGWTLYEAHGLRSWMAAHGLAQCVTTASQAMSACPNAPGFEELTFEPAYVVFPLLAAPAVLAVFGGVRWLTREYETGSYRYTWTLGVSRVRWLAGTLLPLLAVVTAGALLCGLAYDYWFPAGQWRAADGPGVPWGWDQFALSPLTFTACVLASFGIAACAAALIRRTVPAMAAAAVVTVAGIYLADLRLRPWLFTLHPVTARFSDPGSWPSDDRYLLRGWVTDSAGHVVPGFFITHDGGMNIGAGPLGQAMTTGSQATQQAWLAAHHYAYWVSYQPPGRLLAFQAAWAGVALAVAAIAFGVAIWRVAASR